MVSEKLIRQILESLVEIDIRKISKTSNGTTCLISLSSTMRDKAEINLADDDLRARILVIPGIDGFFVRNAKLHVNV